MKKPNFGGYATKYGVLCTDGRTIKADAFKHEDRKQVPLLWRHDDKSPANVLGHAVLEHRDGDGVYARAFFNKTPNGAHSQQMIEHGDINQLSIKAIRLRHEGSNVTYGDLTEVSLVPVGANSDARIDSVYIEHDGMTYEKENEAYLFTGISFELVHEDSDDDDEEYDEDEDDEDDSEDDEESDEEDEDDVEHADSNAQQIFDSMTEEQQVLVGVLIQQAAEGVAHEYSLNHEGENHMFRNVFDQTANRPKETLTHEQMETVFASARRIGSLRDAVLEHAEQYGITNIEELFPDAKNIQNAPEWIKRDDAWVAAVLSGVTSRPFSRIRSRSADITHEEARAKGYIKTNMKKEEFFSLSRRETTPTTVYKKQKLDRDDIQDVSDFNVVAWMKAEMQAMLKEELARAYLFGDNREIDDLDKINESNIRPIATDDPFYTTKVLIPANMAARTLTQKILRSRRYLRGGTGRPTLYTTDELLIDLLLQEDQLGRRYYESEQALAAALGVANIVVCEVLEEGYTDDAGNTLLGVLVNISDYTVGMDTGGNTTMFEDFDIDFNQHKYLIETRRSGALTKHHSAVSLWTTNATRVVPDEPERTAENVVTVPTQNGVVYYHRNVSEGISSDVSGETIHITSDISPVRIEAVADEGYRFPMNITTSWTFDWFDNGNPN